MKPVYNNTKDKTAEFEMINPIRASIYLSKNINNRPLQDSNVCFLTNEMLHGRWKFNGDTIVFDWDGCLRQGQHRLSAIVESGLEEEFLVVRGVDPEAFSTMDCGKSRNGSDALAIAGFKDSAKLKSGLVLIGRYYQMVAKNSPSLWTGKGKISATYILDLAKIYPDFKPLITGHKCVLVCGNVINVCNYIFTKIDPRECRFFMNRLITGEGISKLDPELLLRNRLLSNASSKAKLSQTYIFALFIKAWNARRSETYLKNLRYVELGNAEPFPRAI
jgi:hypothetical protein